MEKSQQIFLCRWGGAVGFILGGVSTLPLVLNPPTPLLIPFGPILMAVSMYQLVNYLLKNALVGTASMTRDIFAGIFTTFLYSISLLTLFGIFLGNEFWAWASVFYMQAAIVSIPIGGIIGLVYGAYLRKVLRGKIILKRDSLFQIFVFGLSIILFICVPILSWWISK
jgi:hypothetical protein